MYDFAYLRDAHDRFWDVIRMELGFGPDHLSRGGDLWAMWLNTDLVMGQTCGMPYRTRLHTVVQYVATPDYGINGCPAGYYNSVLLSSDAGFGLGDCTGATIAYNDAGSQSGWAAPITHLSKRGIVPHRGIETGAHVNSMYAVVQGRADFCAVDAHTFALAMVAHPDLRALCVIDHTDPTPGLPIICAQRFDPNPLRHALDRAYDRLTTDDRKQLRHCGFVTLTPDAYLSVPTPTSPAKLFNRNDHLASF